MAEADFLLREEETRPGGDKDYHVARARAERDAAYRAEPSSAAAAHLKLAAIHMRRARGLTDAGRDSEPS